MKNTLLLISTTIALGLAPLENSKAQVKWYANSAVQMVGTEFQDGSNHNSFYFYNGLRYQTPNVSLGLNVPIILGSNQFRTVENTNTISNSSDHMGSGLSSLEIDLGDVYVYGSYQIVNESFYTPAITLDGYIKFPTSTSNLNFNTDSMDEQIAVGLRKVIDNTSFFGQFGYLFIGNNDDTNFKDPWTISLGIGYSFDNRRHSILVAYDSYANIIEGVQSISQIALGYNFLVRKGLFFTAILSSGLDNSTAVYTISGGLNFEL